MNYRILQIKDPDNCPYLFGSYRIAQKYNFSLLDYRVVYWGTDNSYNGKPDEVVLEDIFRKFNRTTPDDYDRLENMNFQGHSLSVSDIVILDDRIYYCDTAGWVLIK